MRSIPLAGAAAALLLAACAPLHWVKADGTAGQLESDEAQCREEAWREARLRAGAFGAAAPLLLRDAAGRPVVVWPGPFHDPFADPFFEESRLADFCMRSKGYRLERIEQAPESKVQRRGGSAVP